MRIPGALLFSAVVPCLGGGDGSSRHQKVKRREQALPPFSRSVLGDMSALLQGPPSFLREHMFIADISVGTPPQTMKCLLDSGTADIWIPSRRCRSCEQGHHFHADKSDTFMPAVARTDQGLMPVPVRMDYKSGEVVGFLVQDTIGLGWVELQNQSFLIVEEAKLPDHREWDGICGLGWHRMAAEGTGQPLYRHFHPMYHNMQQRADVKPIFSLVPAPDRQAYIVVGEVPEAAVKQGTLSWLEAEPLVEGSPKSFWAVQGTIQARGQDDAVKGRFVVDTASPFLFAPRDLFPGFVRALLPEGHFDKLCGADANAGSLVVCSCGDGLDAEVWLNLGDSGFRLGSDKLFKRVPDSGGGDDLCLLAIQPNPSSSMDPMELLGDLLTGSGITQGGEPEYPDDLDPDGQPFDLPPLPFLIPIAEALNATFMHGHAGGAPITLPAANGSLQNLMPLLPPVAGEEQVEEIVEMKPDGSSCTTTLVWDENGLKRNSTECSDGTQAEKRRLSDAAAARAKKRRLAEKDLWVLGGPFLEHFVTIMDFENQRIGFAQPVGQESAQLERAISMSNPNLEAATPVMDGRAAATQEGQPPGPADAEDPDAHAGGFPWGTLVLFACLGTAACFFYRVQQKTKRRKNLAFDDIEDPAARLEEEAVAAE
jgi:hypothetical protein